MIQDGRRDVGRAVLVDDERMGVRICNELGAMSVRHGR